MTEENKLDKLKVNYSKIQSKFDLPSFEEMNRDFQIEKLADVETDFLIREVRKFVADKFINYLRFIDNILNPSNVPMFIFLITKSLNEEDKRILKDIYKILAKKEVDLIDVDIVFDENKEADFIQKGVEDWNRIKVDILKIVSSINGNWDSKVESRNGGGYFG